MPTQEPTEATIRISAERHERLMRSLEMLSLVEHVLDRVNREAADNVDPDHFGGAQWVVQSLRRELDPLLDEASSGAGA